MNRKRSQPLKSQIDIPWDTTDISANDKADSTQNVPLKQIHIAATQPRRYFDPKALSELADSIKQHGILQPLLVRPRARTGYELVAGERRYRAAKECGLKDVPVVIRELSNEAAFQLALIENLQREDLNPVEETEGILHLLAIRLGRDVEEIPPLLRRLQHERKESAKSSNNVIVKEETDEIDADNNVIESESSQEKTSNNVIGKGETEKIDDENNVIGEQEIEPNESENNVIGTDDSDNLDADNDVIKKEESQAEVSDNNVIVKDETDINKASNQENPELKIVEQVFNGLGLMTWESFANNRLPLLNLPEDILEALRKGSLEYTKAKAIAQIKETLERVAFLNQAIKENWSLSEIKQRIGEKKTPSSTPNAESDDYKERFTAATTKLKKSRIWSDQKKRKQIEKLLSQLEALTQSG
ncbi:MAG: ParB/RepB/Spo0J family partition protein [Richelia sp. RM2_1_2]|nr:ParB/RepB/Spo0J family partition protein [Richelia sp. SM1_7_0]NJN11253.1 ParB/RepB/Spo0J family partition protein [Richelia sp. RM1_1_1]NJO27266.1 ParB/RepB/Spo0J family partition protein [Richelia sp. SL_2_1]NJO64849.1 ParB/RepB/Spo0J family partition protein [Richelia sp. RM2_1_2]